jgi:hypothetical protein
MQPDSYRPISNEDCDILEVTMQTRMNNHPNFFYAGLSRNLLTRIGTAVPVDFECPCACAAMASQLGDWLSSHL